MYGTDAKSYDPSPSQKFHGERVEARNKERAEGAAKIAAANAEKSRRADHHFLDAFMFHLVLGLAIAEIEAATKKSPTVDVPKPVGAQPDHGSPFTKFWENLNAERRTSGHRAALYGEARAAYLDDRPPAGALTFVGDAGIDVRAIPTKPNGYHGLYRVTAPHHGPIWRTVRHDVSPTSPPRVFDLAEAALASAAIHKLGYNKST